LELAEIHAAVGAGDELDRLPIGIQAAWQKYSKVVQRPPQLRQCLRRGLGAPKQPG
jgi:hypothetical protein